MCGAHLICTKYRENGPRHTCAMLMTPWLPVDTSAQYQLEAFQAFNLAQINGLLDPSLLAELGFALTPFNPHVALRAFT